MASSAPGATLWRLCKPMAERKKCFKSEVLALGSRRNTTETGRPRIRRYAWQLILSPNVNDSGYVAMFVKPKRWTHGARSIQPKFQPVRPGKEDHLKRWTRFFETFPVGPNRSIEFWTEISGKFGWMDRAHVVTFFLGKLISKNKKT